MKAKMVAAVAALVLFAANPAQASDSSGLGKGDVPAGGLEFLDSTEVLVWVGDRVAVGPLGEELDPATGELLGRAVSSINSGLENGFMKVSRNFVVKLTKDGEEEARSVLGECLIAEKVEAKWYGVVVRAKALCTEAAPVGSADAGISTERHQSGDPTGACTVSVIGLTLSTLSTVVTFFSSGGLSIFLSGLSTGFTLGQVVDSCFGVHSVTETKKNGAKEPCVLGGYKEYYWNGVRSVPRSMTANCYA